MTASSGWDSIAALILLIPAAVIVWSLVLDIRDWRHQKSMERQWEQNRRYWHIRDMEMDVWGEWRS